MKVIILGAVALAVLGGGGFGAYSYFIKSAEAAVPAEPGTDAKHGDAEHKEAAAHDPEHALPLVELDPMMVPVIDREGVSQVVSLVIAIEALDAVAAEKVKYNQPRLKDAYIQEMYGILNRHAALKGGVLHIGAIKARLDKVTENILGENVVHGVVLQVLQQHPV